MICHILFDVGLFHPKPVGDADGASPVDERVNRAARGDRTAFVSLYREHFAEVHAFAARLLGCSMLAEDLAHEVFLALPRALVRFRGQSSLRSYILSITVRRGRQHLRAAKRRRAIEARAVTADGAAAPGPDVDLHRRQLAARLTRALDALPMAQRAAFILCEVEERSSAEAGEILGEKPGTVRARVFHARRALRERLAELSPESLNGVLEVES